MNSTNKNNAKFLNDILTTNTVSIIEFENNVPNLKFDSDNVTVWQFIILKSLEVEFAYLLPLANHLLDYNYCSVDKNLAKYAALNGYKIEQGLNKFQNIQDSVNENMNGFGFQEKVIISNVPAQNIYNLTKKIVSHANDEDYQEIKEIFDKSGIDISTTKLMQRPQIKSSLLKI